MTDTSASPTGPGGRVRLGRLGLRRLGRSGLRGGGGGARLRRRRRLTGRCRAAGVLGVTNLCAFSQQDDQGNDLVVFVIEGEKLPDRLKLEKLAGNLKQSGKVRFSLIDKFPRGTNGMMKVNRRKVLELVRASWKAEASAENTA